MTSPKQAGLTMIELIVVIVVTTVLILVLMPTVVTGGSIVKGQMIQTLSNMRQIYLATEYMQKEGVARSQSTTGWPGDTGGSFSNWIQQFSPTYMSSNDTSKLFSTPGRVLPRGRIPVQNDNGVLVYSVGSNSPGTTIFLTTANFTNTPLGGMPLQKSAKPYGEKGFVVYRRDGSGAVLKPQVVGSTNAIGSYAPLSR